MRGFASVTATTVLAVALLGSSNAHAALQREQDSTGAETQVGADRVFAYHHAQGKRSQKGHNSAHSASQIALPEMRFASQHAAVESTATQHLAAASEALARSAQASAASATSASSAQAVKSHAKARDQAKAAVVAKAHGTAAAEARAHSKAKSGSAKAKSKSEAVPGGGAAEVAPKTTHVDGYPGDASVSTMKLSSPIYGSYTRNYGSVSQPLAEGSGYGGFTGNVDPTGFNFQHDDTTPTGGQRGWGASTLSGHPFGSAYPARMKVRQATSVNGLSPLGITATLSDAQYTLMGPKSLGPYGVDGIGTMSTGPGANSVGFGLALPPVMVGPAVHSLANAVPGIPTTAEGVVLTSSGRKNKKHVVVINPSPRTAVPQVQLAGMGSAISSSAGPHSGQVAPVGVNSPNGDVSTTVAQLSGRPLVNGRPINGMRLTYDPMLVTQRALYMGGGINQYGTPGVIKQLGVSYPSPAFDRYSSVVPTGKLTMQVHTTPLSSLILGANINADMQRQFLSQRDPITGLPLSVSTMMGGAMAPGMGAMGGGMGAMGGGMGAMGGGMGGMGGGMGGMGGGMGGMGGMGGGMGGMGGV